MIKRDRPIFIPSDRTWYYLGARNAPSVRQAEIIQRPPGVYIGPFDNTPPTENVADHNEDHNWRSKEKSPHCRKEAVLEKNWPKLRAERKHDEYVNKQHRHDKSVVCQTPRRTDGHKISNNMNNSTRLRFQTRHLPEWITIRDIPDEEPRRSIRDPAYSKLHGGHDRTKSPQLRQQMMKYAA